MEANRRESAMPFDVVYQEWYETMYRYIRSHVDSNETAQELSQNVFTAAWRHWDDYNEACGGVRAWLYCIARNLLKNHYRDQKRLISLDELRENGSQDPADHSFGQSVRLMEHRAVLAKALQALPEQPRQIILLRYFAGKTNQEIAQLLGISNGNVRVILTRGLQKLHEILQNTGFEWEE